MQNSIILGGAKTYWNKWGYLGWAYNWDWPFTKTGPIYYQTPSSKLGYSGPLSSYTAPPSCFGKPHILLRPLSLQIFFFFEEKGKLN